jgi:hypothetical protein
MLETNSAPTNINLSLKVTLENNGYYLCQLSNPDASQNMINCYGQSQEHAIAIALEQLAEQYRQIAEAQQKRVSSK